MEIDPFGATPSERFLLHRRLITLGTLVRVLSPYPLHQLPPFPTVRGFTASEVLVVRQVCAAIPSAWLAALSSFTLGPSLYCVHRLMYDLDPNMLLHVAGTCDHHPLTRAQDLSPPPGLSLSHCSTSPTFPFPAAALVPMYYSSSGLCLGGASLPWLGYRLAVPGIPTTSFLYRSVLRLPPVRDHPVARSWAQRYPGPLNWRRLAAITYSPGLPVKARDVLLRTLFRSLQVWVRASVPPIL